MLFNAMEATAIANLRSENIHVQIERDQRVDQIG